MKNAIMITQNDLRVLSDILDFAAAMSDEELQFYIREGEDWENSRLLEQERYNNIIRMKKLIKGLLDK